MNYGGENNAVSITAMNTSGVRECGEGMSPIDDENCSSVSSGEENGYSKDYTKIGIIGTITLLTIVFNIAVILAIFTRNVKITRMYYFIVHLSFADMLTAFLTLLPEIVWTWTTPNFYGGNTVCKTVKFIQMIGPYLSSYVLVMTAVDRYQAICFPLSNCTWTPRRSNAMILIAWAMSFLLCIPQAFIFQGDSKKGTCLSNFAPSWGKKAYVTWFAISNFFIPFIIIVFCYNRICQVIWENFNNKTTRDPSRKTRGPLCTNVSWTPRWHISVPPSNQEIATTTRCINQGRCDCRDNISSVNSYGQENSASRSLNDHCQCQKSDGVEAGCSNVCSTPLLAFQKKKTSSWRQHQKGEMDSSLLRRQTTEVEEADDGLVVAPIHPRTHSIKGISKAKVKTVKLTVVVISAYIICSSPFICVHLWATWVNPSQHVVISMKWLFWLLTLNSVINPLIYMMFNTNLVYSLSRAFCPRRFFVAPIAAVSALRNRWVVDKDSDAQGNMDRDSVPMAYRTKRAGRKTVIDGPSTFSSNLEMSKMRTKDAPAAFTSPPLNTLTEMAVVDQAGGGTSSGRSSEVPNSYGEFKTTFALIHADNKRDLIEQTRRNIIMQTSESHLASSLLKVTRV